VHVRHWDAALGKEEFQKEYGKTLKSNRDNRHHAAAPGTVAVSSSTGIRHYDLASGRGRFWAFPKKDTGFGPPRSLYGSPVVLAISGDGKLLSAALQVRGGKNDNFYATVLWEARTGQEIHLLKGHEMNVKTLAWSADGRVLATGDNSTP